MVGRKGSRSGGFFVCLFMCLLSCSKRAQLESYPSIYPRDFQCPPVWKSLPSCLPEVRWGQPEALSSNFVWKRCSIESALISDLSPFLNTGLPGDPLSFPKHLSSCVFLTQCTCTDGPFWLTLGRRSLLEQHFLYLTRPRLGRAWVSWVWKITPGRHPVHLFEGWTREQCIHGALKYNLLSASVPLAPLLWSECQRQHQER